MENDKSGVTVFRLIWINTSGYYHPLCWYLELISHDLLIACCISNPNSDPPVFLLKACCLLLNRTPRPLISQMTLPRFFPTLQRLHALHALPLSFVRRDLTTAPRRKSIQTIQGKPRHVPNP